MSHSDSDISDDSITEPSAEAELSEPIDAEFREAPIDVSQSRRGGPGWPAAVGLMVMASGLGAVLGYSASELAPGILVSTAETEDVSEMPSPSDLAEDLAELQGQLDGMETAFEDAMGTVPDVGPLESRLAGLEASIAAQASTTTASGREPSIDVAGLQARLSAVESNMAGFAQSLETALAGPQAERAALSAQAEVLANDIRDIELRIEELADVATRQVGQNLSRQTALAEAALALSQMDVAARRGVGFAPALATLRRVRPNDPAITVLTPISIEGAPTLSQLRSRFDVLAPQLLATRASGQPSRGLLGVAEQVFGDAIQTGPAQGDPLAAKLNAASAALESDDIGGALIALESLDGEAADLAAPWLAGAEARRTLERSLDTLRLDLMAEDR